MTTVAEVDRVRTVARMLGRILLSLTGLAVTGFVLLVLIGLWDRHEQEITVALSRIYERYLASQAAFSSNPRARAEKPERAGTVGRVAKPQTFQEQPKLVGTGAVGSANQGMSVALSADGNTAIVGGPGPNNADRERPPFAGPAGAAWVFTRSGGGWRQQAKLVGAITDYGGGLWSQGASVTVSADGNTAIIGGPSDNRTTGAAWVFTRSDGVWTQQGNKLVGSGAGEPPLPPGQGMSVALSADGNTAIIGGWGAEGAWVFTRRGSAWSQQGKKLVGTGAVGKARQGMSVALSSDGNTAIVGGWSDNSKTGAAWVFTRNGGVWTQQGKKLVGSDAVGSARQGMSVALSADGNTAVVGGPGDNPWDRQAPFGLGATGAAWVFTRSGGVWTQQNKLVSTGAVGRLGTSVALSADGNIAIVGGFAEDGGVALVFTRTGGQWAQDKKLVGTGAVGKSTASVALSADGRVVMLGASNDNGGVGAAWVFTRSSGYWAQDNNLVGSSAVGKAAPAASVERSIAIVGASNDNAGRSAAAVFTRGRDGSNSQDLATSAASNPATNFEE
jgi:FG-GAP repeat